MKTTKDSLQNYLSKYMEHLKLSGYSPATLIMKSSHIEKFIAWCNDYGYKAPQSVTTQVLCSYQRYVNSLKGKNRKALSLRTRYNKISDVLCFFSFLAEKGNILYNPAEGIELPKIPRRLPLDVLTIEECRKIISVPDTNTAIGIRDRAILELLYSTGLRLKEFINLEVNDIDRQRELILIREGKGKKDRYIPIGHSSLSWLIKYTDEVRSKLLNGKKSDVLFLSFRGTQFTSRGAEHLVERIMKKSGVEKKGSFLLFRHSLATGMLENEADIRYIQQILGHSSLESTQIYTHVSIAKLKEVHKKTHPAKLSRFLEEGL